MKLRNFGYILILSFSISACLITQPKIPVMHSIAEMPSLSLLTLRDWQLAERTAQNALQFNTTQISAWKNPETGIYGTFMAIGNFKSAKGYQCRNFLMKIKFFGRTQEVNGTGCKSENKIWTFRKVLPTLIKLPQ